MTKEDNIKEAQNYEDSLIYSSISEQCDIKKAFVAGAEWRIKSVWHNLPNDLPEKENTWISLELVFEGRLVYLPVEWVNDGEGAPSQATRWAYIDDLTPERKEEAK